uniref:Uncharacterized protein n=1 Tax=Anopheles melas TaxID=34690 RepID=A0A182TM25_9DIPT
MIVTEQTTIPCDLCIERGQIELLITGRIGADLLERLQHMVRYWRLDRQMGTLRLEPVRVGIVRHPVQHTVRTGVRVLAGRIGAIVAGLLRRDAVARLVPIVVRTARVVVLLLRQDDGLRFGRTERQRSTETLLGSGQHTAHGDRGQDKLWPVPCEAGCS